MTYDEIEKYLLNMNGVWLDSQDGDVIFRIGSEDDSKVVATVKQNSSPLQISLRCDERLAKVLREKYESVLPASNMNKKYWNTIICSGQLSVQEIFDLATLSYNLSIA